MLINNVRKGICTAFHVMLGMSIRCYLIDSHEIPTQRRMSILSHRVLGGVGGGGGKNPFMYEIFQEIRNQSLNIMTYGKRECRNPFMHEIF